VPASYGEEGSWVGSWRLVIGGSNSSLSGDDTSTAMQQ